jgi:hypothetical protein
VVVAVLAPVTAFNLFLLFAVIRRLRVLSAASTTPAASLPEVGLAIGDFVATALDGAIVSTADLAGGARNVVCFMVGCEPCKTQMAAMRADERLDRERTLVFVFGDPLGEADRELAESVRDLGTVALLPMGDQVADALGGIEGFPTLIRTEGGKIAAISRRWDQITETPTSPEVPASASVGAAL